MTTALPITSATNIATFDDLVTVIGSYMNDDAFADISAVFVTTTEAEMNRRLALKPVRPMHIKASLTIDGEYVDAPTGTLDIDSIEVPDYWKIDPSTPQNLALLQQERQAYLASLGSGTSIVPPKYYAWIGSQFRFFPAPDDDFTATIIYWEKLPALSASNQTNWMLSDHPDAYLTGCLAWASAYQPDEQKRDFWLGMFDQIMERVLSSYPSRPNMTPLRSDVGLMNRPVLA